MRRTLAVVTMAMLAVVLLGPPAQAVPRTPPVPALPVPAQVAKGLAQRQASVERRRPTVPWAGHRGLTSPVDSPNAVVLDPLTDTLYVSSDPGPIAVIDARTCNAVTQRCQPPVATLPGEPNPPAIAVDPARHTLYETADVAGVSSLLVFDTTRCNARRSTGCAQPTAVLPDASDIPIGLTVDRASHTLYVGHVADVVGVLDTAVCNGPHPAGCSGYLARIAVGPGPVFVTVDHANRTLYAPDNGPGADETGSTMSVVDISRCRAGDVSGCGDQPFTATVGRGTFVATVDAAVDTVYVSNPTDSTVSVLPRSTCNGHDHSGCPTSTPTAIKPGFDPQLMAVDAVSKTLFVHVQDSDVLAAVDTRSCNAHRTSGCGDRPRRIQTGGQPFWLTFDARTRTLYTADRAASVLQATDARTCNALTRRGCRRDVPSVPGADGGWALDAPHHTYLQAASDGSVLLTDTNRCTATRPGRCAGASVRVRVGGTLGSTTIDPGTHTAYVGTQDDTGLLVIDTATCNVARHDDCRPRAVVAVPDVGFPYVDERTHTVFMGQFNDGRVAVIPGATCNATDVSGCGSPRFVAAGEHPYTITFDDSNDTAYVDNSFGVGGTLTLLPLAACAAGSADCKAVATTAIDGEPGGGSVDPATHTLYVAQFADETLGAVSLIDTAACNAHRTAGCGTTWPTTPGPRGTFAATVVPSRHTLFAANLFDSTVSIIDTRRCNAADQSGCPERPLRIGVGDGPVASFADGRTLYQATFVYGRTSLIDLDHPCRRHRCFR